MASTFRRVTPSRRQTFSRLGFYTAALFIALAGCATKRTDDTAKADQLGILVMAHGGGKTWNNEVTDALAPLGADHPMEIAFGMADAVSLQAGVSALEARGVLDIAVVRLFVSGESFKERTEQILGLAPGAPARPADDDTGHDSHGGHSMAFWRLDTNAAFALSREGLSDAPEMGEVLVERARALSRDPARESVLVLAHGPGDDAENQRWLDKIDARADAVRQAMPFREVKVETLREDWPEKREAAERRVRAFVEAADRAGTAIVIPFRVQGFGPYAEVLEGLDYVSDGRGLVPSPEVEQWARRQVDELAAGDFRTPLADPPEA